MDSAVIVTIGSIAAALITGMLGYAAKRVAPRVSKNAVVVESALALVESHRREHEQDVAEIEARRRVHEQDVAEIDALRRQVDALRQENERLRRA